MWPIAWNVITQKVFELLIIGALVLFIEHRLKRSLFEYQTRFTKLHEKRAEVIAELYKKLVQTQKNLQSMANALEANALDTASLSKDKWRKAVRESGIAFWNYFSENCLYLPESLCNKIENLNKSLTLTYTQLFLIDISQNLGSGSEANRQQDTHDLDQALDSLANAIPSIRREIEREFRRLLGDTNRANHRR